MWHTFSECVPDVQYSVCGTHSHNVCQTPNTVCVVGLLCVTCACVCAPFWCSCFCRRCAPPSSWPPSPRLPSWPSSWRPALRCLRASCVCEPRRGWGGRSQTLRRLQSCPALQHEHAWPSAGLRQVPLRQVPLRQVRRRQVPLRKVPLRRSRRRRVRGMWGVTRMRR